MQHKVNHAQDLKIQKVASVKAKDKVTGEADKAQLDALTNLTMKMEMDLTTEITDMEEVIMINPLDEKKSTRKCRDNTKIYDFFT